MKKRVILPALAVTFLLTGCASVQERITEKMLQKSGILDADTYQEYVLLTSGGKLDVNGYYIEDGPEIPQSHPQVRVTFAENSSVNIQYYSDKSHRTKIDTADCYLNPGDSVYAVVSVKDEVSSSMYRFSEFRVYEYSEDGRRMQSSELAMTENAGEYSLTIPKTFAGTSISLEPIGLYDQRMITLDDYFLDDSGKKHPLSGTWRINQTEYTENTAKINPLSPYIVSYTYDTDTYFYVESSPECFYTNSIDGVVVFNQCEPEDETPEYSVALQKYFSVTLVSGMDRIVRVNGGEEKKIRVNGELRCDHLKYGDGITIETDREWASLENCRELILTDTEQFPNGKYRYTLIVPERGGEFVFTPDSFVYDHGEITFKCFGKTVTTTQILAKGSKIYYEQTSADAGYWLAGTLAEHYIVVGKREDTIAALESIHFTPMVDVTVSLPQPETGGSIVYKLDGTRINGSNISTHSGAVISMKFNPWEGWFSSKVGEITYIVNDEKMQIIHADGVPIEDVFAEDENHKPELTVKLEKSVGETMEFTLAASGYRMDVASYDGGWKVQNVFNKDAAEYDIISNKQILVSNQKVGTDQPIVITMSKRAIQAGTAVRMVITLTDTNGKKTNEIRYVDDLSNPLDPIYIYQRGRNANSETWYKAAEITIGVVGIEKLTQPKPAENTRITVKDNTTGNVLTAGDLLEADTKVAVTISPALGYYLTGKNVSNDIYTKTMKYADFKKNIQSVLADHPAVKYYTITLDKSDVFATYTYKIDGKEALGTIQVKDGQKLELSYEITDPTYKLSKSHGGFMGLGASTQKATAAITITSDMHEKRITKSDFNIETVKGG